MARLSWAQFASNWKANLPVLMHRFPHAKAQEFDKGKISPNALSRVIAQSHDLTEHEAREELDQFLDLQSLARSALDLRTHDAALVSMK